MLWPDTAHVPASAIRAAGEALEMSRAVLRTAGRQEWARFIASVVCANLEGSRTRYAVVTMAPGVLVAFGPFATWAGANKYIAAGDLGHPAQVLPLVPAPLAGRPRHFR